MYKNDTLVCKCLCRSGQDKRNTLTNPRFVLRPSKSPLQSMRFTIRIFVFVYYILYEYLLFKKNEKLGSLPRYLVEKNQRKKVLESRTEKKTKCNSSASSIHLVYIFTGR